MSMSVRMMIVMKSGVTESRGCCSCSCGSRSRTMSRCEGCATTSRGNMQEEEENKVKTRDKTNYLGSTSLQQTAGGVTTHLQG
jgi:hypothetical protein